MKKKPVTTVLRVLDIDASEVNQHTINFLTSYHRSYIDAMENMGEDMFNVLDAADEKKWLTEMGRYKQSYKDAIAEEVGQLKKLCDKSNCSYVRFINIKIS